MKSKTFVMLLVVAGILVALSYFRFSTEKQNSGRSMGEKLFTDLPVNEIAKVTLMDAENQVTLVKGETVWQVEERQGYPADFDELRDMVVKLSKLKIGRRFAASSESITRLSLASPVAGDAQGKGKRILLSNASGNMLADVILGDTRKTDTGANAGQYLMKADIKEVFLVDDSFPFLKTSPPQWLEKEVIDIKADEIASVTCFVGGDKTPAYSLSRPEKGEKATLEPLPEGRTENRSKIDQVFDALAPLTLDDVKPGNQAEQVVDKADQTRLVYRLYDGREISVFPDSDGEETHTVRLTARQGNKSKVEIPDKASGETQTTEDKGTEEKTATAPDEDETDNQSAEQINDNVGPWVFTVKKWQFDSLVTQPESLLEEVEKDGKTS